MKAVLNHCRLKAAVSVAFMLSLTGASIADEVTSKSLKTAANQPLLGDQTSEYIRDFLSDPRRSGSLAGSIIGGALSAHPAGPILGSLVGFLVGKQSMFNEDKAKAERASVLYARRDIVPLPGQTNTVPTISFSSSQVVDFNLTQTVKTSQGAEYSPMAAPADSGFSRERITAMCGGQSLLDARLKALCFYSQGG